MKIQDIIFFVVFIALIFKQNPRWFATAGLTSLLLSIPLFSFWVFFTAERLTWYTGAFFLLAIILHLFRIQNNER